MIIVEGPNLSGKTTVARLIKQDWELRPVYIRSWKNKGRLWLSSLVQVTSGPNAVVDRCWITESVYHRPCRLRMDQLYYLALTTMSNASLLLIRLPSLETLEERGVERKVGGATIPFESVYKRYHQLKKHRLRINTTDLYSVRLDFLLHENTVFAEYPDFTAQHLTLYREDYKVRAMKRALYTAKRLCGIGSMEPEVLFLADKVNPNVTKKPMTPPFVPVSNNSTGSYFMRMLYHSGIDLRKIHIHNAQTQSGRHYSKNLVKILEPKIIIALGDVAHEAARKHFKCGAKVGKLPHPAKLNRFSTHEEAFFAEELKNVIEKLGGSSKLFRR